MTRFPSTIDRYMSSALLTAEPGRPLHEALRSMREHGVRHLPVVTQGRIVGLLSMQGAELAKAQKSGSSARLEIADAMDENPHVVDPDEPADRVARGMAQRRSDCSIVAHAGRLVGIFTATDALLALAALLENERGSTLSTARPTAQRPKPAAAKKSSKRLSAGTPRRVRP